MKTWFQAACHFLGGGGGSSPPPPPPPPPPPATQSSPLVSQAGLAQKNVLAAGAGAGVDNTIMSSPMGAPAPSTAKQTLGS